MKEGLNKNKRKGFSFFREIKSEFKRITWLDKKELLLLAKIVLSSIFLMGLSIYVVDICILKFFNGLSFVFKGLFLR